MVSTSFVTENHTVNSTGKLPKNGIVIRKLSFAPSELCRRIFVYGDAISAPPGNALLWFTAVRFLNGQEAFPLTTAAQNMYDLR